MKQALLLTTCAAIAAGGSLNAALIFDEAFDYGTTTFPIRDIQVYADAGTTTGVVRHDHDGGLDLSTMNGESGGSLWHDFGNGTRLAARTVSFDPFPSSSAGDTFWIAGILQINNLDNSTQVIFNNGQAVNRWGFGVNGSGEVFLHGSDSGAVGAAHTIGTTVTGDGSTYLFVSRATIGSGGNSNKQSTIDFWFNPSDTSSVAALGTADFTTGNDSKIGRTTGSYSSLSINLAFGNRADEIRFGGDLVDVIGVPEPSTYALFGGFIALGLVMLRRRIR